jgi:predicted Zn-dependent protease with MMP-like domain
MKIKNETQWDTKDLKKLFTEVCKQMGETTKRTIEVKISKKRFGLSHYHGLGSCSRNWVELRIPDTHCIVGSDGRDQILELEHPDSIKIAQILIHEIGHNQGLVHKEMANCWDIDCDWANQFIINKKFEKPKIEINLKQQRYKLVIKRLTEKETKMKRLIKQIKKLQAKKKYYEKKNGDVGNALSA